MFVLERASCNFGKFFFFCTLASLLLSAGGEAWSYTEEDCIRCHREGSSGSTFHISIREFKSSIHSRDEMTCQDCHADVKDKAHETTTGLGAVDCGRCHDQKNLHGLQSKTADNCPQCYFCHTKHDILKKDNVMSSVNPANLKETCRSCHPRECGQTNLLSWLPSLQIASHKKEDFSRAYRRDNCLGCHQGKAAHGGREPVDARDCYKCHFPQNGQSRLFGYIHPDAHPDKHSGMFAVALLYLFLIFVLLVGGFVFYVQTFSYKRQGRRR